MVLNIEFYSYLSHKSWITSRKLTDFLELHSILEKFFVNVPKLPNKLSHNTKILSELNNKKLILNNFLDVKLLFIL